MSKLPEKVEIILDNKTIAKLAIAIAHAQLLRESEVNGPLTRKILELLDNIDSLDHFIHYEPGSTL